MVRSVKQVSGTPHVSARPKPKIIRWDIRKEKPAYADPSYRPPPKPIQSPTQIYPRETKI